MCHLHLSPVLLSFKWCDSQTFNSLTCRLVTRRLATRRLANSQLAHYPDSIFCPSVLAFFFLARYTVSRISAEIDSLNYILVLKAWHKSFPRGYIAKKDMADRDCTGDWVYILQTIYITFIISSSTNTASRSRRVNVLLDSGLCRYPWAPASSIISEIRSVFYVICNIILSLYKQIADNILTSGPWAATLT